MKKNPIAEMAQFVAEYQKAYRIGEQQKEAMYEEAVLLIEDTARTLNKWFKETNVGLSAYVTHKLPSGHTSNTPVIRLRGRSGYEYGGVLLGVSVPSHKHEVYQIESCNSAYVYEQPRLIHGYSSNDELPDRVKEGSFNSLEEALKSRRIEQTLKYAIKRES
jgi:hypothetical protein